jgi:alpha-D-ribose 1-methylphosphonate 5-triphosphate diphosphatase
MPELLAPLAQHRLLRLVSLMDHTPGTGQYGDLTRYRLMRIRDGEAPESLDATIAALQAQQARLRGPNRAALLDLMRGRAVLASHDDRTLDEVAENLADGIGVAEFPVTLEAAAAAHAGGQKVIAGAPNLVRGGSHTGNVGVLDLLRAGFVDALTSDYVPASLIEAAFMAASQGLLPLPHALAMVADAPARLVGFFDRGRVAVGLRADLVRVRLHDGLPVVRQVWRAGERVI